MEKALRYSGELVDASTVFDTNEKFLCPCCGMPVRLVLGTDLISGHFRHLAGSRSIVGGYCELFSKESASKRNARVFSEKAVHEKADALRAVLDKMSKEEVIDAAVAMHKAAATEIGRIHREMETAWEDVRRDVERDYQAARRKIDKEIEAFELEKKIQLEQLRDVKIRLDRRELSVQYREKLVDFLKFPQSPKEVVKKYLFGVSTQMINYPDAEKAIDRLFK